MPPQAEVVENNPPVFIGYGEDVRSGCLAGPLWEGSAVRCLTVPGAAGLSVVGPLVLVSTCPTAEKEPRRSRRLVLGVPGAHWETLSSPDAPFLGRKLG